MDVEITNRKENPLLDRVEVQFTVHHPAEHTPKRSEVRDKIAALVNANKGLVVVDHMNTIFGRTQTKGYAKVYENANRLRAVEPDYMLKRNGISGGEQAAQAAEE